METRRSRVTWALAAIALLPGTILSCHREPGGKPPGRPRNVVLVVLDTLRPDHLGCYGYARPTSPNLDALARRCRVFERAVTVSPWTAPALISLVTSLHPEVHQVIDSPNPGRMSESVTTLAEILKARGYRTAAFTEGGYAKGQFGLDQGFDLFPSNPGDRPDEHNILAHKSRIHANVDRTLAWLRERKGEPFFLLFHTYEIHSPYRAPEEDVRRFDPGFDPGAERERVRAIVETWNRERTIGREGCELLLQERMRTALLGLPMIEDPKALYRIAKEVGIDPGEPWRLEPIVQRACDLYDGGIRHADEELARLWRALEDPARIEDTILVVVSDHGEGLGEHGEMEHGSVLHEEALRIVLMLRAPGVEPGRVRSVVSLRDRSPSALELSGAGPAGVRIQGHSLVSWLAPSSAEEESEFPAYSHGRTSVEREADALYSLRLGRWHLIADLAAGTDRLFDVDADPGETADVSAGWPEVAARLKKLLLRQQAENLALKKALGAGVQRLDLDRETLEELRRLGYAGDGGERGK